MSYRYCSYVHVIYENVHYAVPEDWEHPGGQDDILNARGTDITDDFDAVGHSRDALNELKGFGTIPITHKGSEYLINVNWVATDELMKSLGDHTAKDGHFQRFLSVLSKGEEETSKLIEETWPEEAKAYMEKHFKLPCGKKATGAPPPSCPAASATPTSSPSQIEEVKPAAADGEKKVVAEEKSAASDPSVKSTSSTPDAKCPCANPRVLGALAVGIAALFFVNKFIIGGSKNQK